MIQNKKIQDAFPAGTNVTIRVMGDEGYYKGVLDFTDLVGIMLTEYTYEVGGWDTGVNNGYKFFPYTAIVSITAAHISNGGGN
jgi:hypothetical protein